MNSIQNLNKINLNKCRYLYETMFKKLINNPLDTIGNAVKINLLKVERSELETAKKNYEKKCKKYDEQVEFKSELITLISVNDITINKLRTIFEQNNVKYDNNITEFEMECHDEELKSYKRLFDSITKSNALIIETNEIINQNIGINKQIYLDKIKEIDEKLSRVNQSLRSTRDKQFGKKDNKNEKKHEENLIHMSSDSD